MTTEVQTKTAAVSAQLRKRATDAIVGKKGADVAAAFTALANAVDAADNGDLYGVMDTFVADFKL